MKRISITAEELAILEGTIFNGTFEEAMAFPLEGRSPDFQREVMEYRAVLKPLVDIYRSRTGSSPRLEALERELAAATNQTIRHELSHDILAEVAGPKHLWRLNEARSYGSAIPLTAEWVRDYEARQTGLVQLVTEFEGHQLTTLNVKGRPAWIAGDVATSLGYVEPKQITIKISSDWADDFIEGQDYIKVDGDDLKALKELVTSKVTGPQVLDKRASSVLVLFESGLHTVLLRTEKPTGKRLRRKLVEEILPQIARTGEYSPTREVVNNIVVEKATEVIDITAARERRLLMKEETNRARIELARSQFAYNAVMHLVELRKDLPAPVRNAYATLATERALGQPLTELRPSLPAAWRTATAIGESFGVSAQIVGKTAKALGMQVNAGLPGISRRSLTTAKNSPKKGPVDQWLYSPEAEELIQESLVRQGRIPAQSA